MSSQVLRDLNDVLLSLTGIDCELVAMDGTGHTSDYANKYYTKEVKQEKATLKTILQSILTQD